MGGIHVRPNSWFMHVISNAYELYSSYDRVNFIKIISGPPRYFVLGIIFAVLCGDNNTIYTTIKTIMDSR